MDVAIVGAGISGIAAARILLENDIPAVVFEGKERIGGLVQCEIVDNNLFHKTGGHVFNSKNRRVLEWFWSKFQRDDEFLSAKRKAKILLNDNFVGYPLEDYLYQLTPEKVSTIVQELVQLSRAAVRSPLSYSSFGEFLASNFGPSLYELYFKPYNEKIWKTDLNGIPIEWLEGKLPMPNIESMMVNNILRREDQSMVHSSFYYPRAGGSQFIVERLAEGVTIRTNFGVRRMELKVDGWFINGEGPFGAVIYTGDLRRLASTLMFENGGLTGLDALLNRAEAFRSNGTSNALCYTDPIDLSWLYLPNPELKAHRIIYTGNFSHNNNKVGKKTCVVEFSGKIEEAEIAPELKHLPGNLILIKSNYEPNSYIIQDSDTRTIVRGIKQSLLPTNFHLLGRFAEWEYYNMDKAIEAAFSVTDGLTGSHQ